MEWNETFTSNADGAPRRKLSTEGYNAAVAYGLAHLNEKHNSRGESTSGARSGGIEYVGDHVVSVLYMEEGTLHSIVVRRV
jgi:hypothetical protein